MDRETKLIQALSDLTQVVVSIQKNVGIIIDVCSSLKERIEYLEEKEQKDDR